MYAHLVRCLTCSAAPQATPPGYSYRGNSTSTAPSLTLTQNVLLDRVVLGEPASYVFSTRPYHDTAMGAGATIYLGAGATIFLGAGAAIFSGAGATGGWGWGHHFLGATTAPPKGSQAPVNPGASDLTVVWGPEWCQAITNLRDKGVFMARGGSVCLKLPNRWRPRGALVASSCTTPLLLQPPSPLFSAPWCPVCPAAPIVHCPELSCPWGRSLRESPRVL